MTNSKARLALLSSVSTAAAIFLVPTTAQAQATSCSQTGTTITCVDGTTTVLTATTDAATTTVAGPGLVTANTTAPSTTSYVATGPIATTGVGAANLTSTGGALTFTPSGTGAGVNLTTTGGTAANGLTLNTAGQSATVTVGNISTTGISSFGVLANGGTDLTLKTGNVTTTGATSGGISAAAQTGNISLLTSNISTTGTGALLGSTAGNIVATTAAINTTGDGAFGLSATTAGTGTVKTDVVSVTTTGLGSTGLLIRGGTGAINAGYGNITTSGLVNGANSASALDVASTGTITLRGLNATLRTNGAGVTAALLNGAGVIGDLGSITTTGAGAQGAIVTSTAPVNLNVGTVATTGNGVTVNAGANAVMLTTGTVTATDVGATGTVINSTGAVTFIGGKQTANGANALSINGGAGAINATVNGAATTGTGTAVAITGTGPLTFANTGSITTAGATSTGINISGVTTASVNCGNVSTTGANSPAVVVAANGNTTVTCGTVTTTGAASDAITVSNTAGTTTVTGGTTSATGLGSRGIVVSSSAPAATGLVTVNTGAVTANGNAVMATSTGGANVVVNGNGNIASTTGTGITATTGGTTQVTINAGTTTTGVQGVNLQGVAGNTLIVNGTLKNSTGTTPYTVLNGGPFTLTLGSTGTIVGPLTFTTGNDTFNNQGTFALPAMLDFLTGTDVLNNTGTLTAFTGTSTINNLETFNNVGGLIDMRDGVANDVVNLTNSNYVATGNARLGIDVIGTSGANTADRLVIGGTTTGTTTVLANFINPVIDPTGALIVDSTPNNVAAGQFVLTGPTNFGLINYAIQVRGGDAYIVSTPDARAYDTVFVGRQARDLWYQSADAYSAYATARRVSFGQERSHPLGIWAQLYGERQTAGDRNRTATAFGTAFAVDDRIRTDFRGAQVGLDFGASNFVVGITGGYERAHATSDFATIITTEGYNYGAYAQFGMTTGLYAGALIKRDDYRTVLTNGTFANGYANPRSHSTGAEGEIGFRTGGVDNLNFDIGAGVAYVRSNMNTFNFGNVNFTQDKMTSVRGQVHARATFAGPIAPFIEARGFHEFRDNNSYLLRSGLSTTTLDGNGKGTWVRLEAGIGGGTKGGPLLSAWADVGDTQGYGLRAGFRF
jgi:hypothetical protein